MAKFKQIDIDVDIHRVIESNRTSFSDTDNDILRRILLDTPRQRAQTVSVRKPTAAFDSRNRGDWYVSFFGKEHSAPNMKEAYKQVLLLLNDRYPDFLQAFSKCCTPYRLFISKQPEAIYGSTPSLATDHAKPLTDGWYFDTNLSKEQVKARLIAACDVVGAIYGRDILIAEK